MEKRIFLDFVENTISNNPDWSEETILRVTRPLTMSINKKVNDAQEKRVTAEAALTMAIPYINKKVPETLLWTIEDAIINSGFVGGSPYARELEEKHKKQLKPPTE